MSREDPQIKLRLPEELRDAIREAADDNGRSMNAEIVYRLENSFDPNYLGSEMRRLQLNYDASTGSENRAMMMLAKNRVLYVLLDADGKPTSWPETMMHLEAIAAGLDGAVEKIEAAVFTEAQVSSAEREDAWFSLLEFYRRQRTSSAD